MLNIDACQREGNLYILCSRYENIYKSDRVLVVDLKDETLRDILMLPKYNYSSLCFDGNRFYAFNETRCTIDVLEER